MRTYRRLQVLPRSAANWARVTTRSTTVYVKRPQVETPTPIGTNISEVNEISSDCSARRRVKYYLILIRFNAERLQVLTEEKPMNWSCLDPIVKQMTTYPTDPQCPSWSRRRYRALLRDLIRHHDQLNRALKRVRSGTPSRAAQDELLLARDFIMRAGNHCWHLICVLDDYPCLASDE